MNYESIDLTRQAFLYFDSTIILGKKFKDQDKFINESRLRKVNIYNTNGDYQKCIDESTLYINRYARDDQYNLVYQFYNQRAQAFYYQSQYKEALKDLDSAYNNAGANNDTYETATSLKTRALINTRQGNVTAALFNFKQAIQLRIKSGDHGQVSDDYTDFGNYYLESKNYQKAKECYLKAIQYATDPEDYPRISKGKLNLGLCAFYENALQAAKGYYQEAIEYLHVNAGKNFLQNPSSQKLNVLPGREHVLNVFGNKTELLLHLFKQTNEKKYLEKALETALLTDTLITDLRHDQSGEQSKLYWRNRAREFYGNAMEVCYLAANTSLAFFFMEKSRAALLNDQLNEQKAGNYLPAFEEQHQQALKINIITKQQELSAVSEASKDYTTKQYRLLQAKEDFDDYIHSLEKKYPAYYQNKYADVVPNLIDLQKYLARERQSFVHYFIGDTASYILLTTANAVKFIRLSRNEFSGQQLNRYLRLCSDKEFLNSQFPGPFFLLSDSIYRSLFKPLQLPKGRIIICTDNYLMPFESLSMDDSGKRFLIQDYAFSYVYSARFLLKHFSDLLAQGDFLGIAPVSFTSSMHLPALVNSSIALNKSASNYRNKKMLTNTEASKNKFLEELPVYSVVNIFSHAAADSSENEPKLFLADSVVRLSELQLLNSPSTKLVVLSACQTNAGKNATGEGVYSLARGFSAAGIPSVAATLWAADEQSVYDISFLFHQNLARGLPKDIALQQAKITYLQTIAKEDTEKELPYYWANMLLMGDSAPLRLTASSNHIVKETAMIAGAVILPGLVVLYIQRRRKAKTNAAIKSLAE